MSQKIDFDVVDGSQPPHSPKQVGFDVWADGVDKVRVATDVLSVTFTGLTVGSSYVFHVQAVDETNAGVGPVISSDPYVVPDNAPVVFKLPSAIRVSEV